MALRCNIDARGKRFRLLGGVVTLLVGAALLVWAIRTGGVLAWCVTAACALAGSFMVFEARAGWCALRAMGFGTPI